MFKYKYMTFKHLNGFKKYKYSAIDTSPLSRYVMHPAWNATVQFLPKWLAPNLITFAGFLCMLINVIILLMYDYDCTAAGRSGADAVEKEYGIPKPVLIICGVMLFLAYNLDGLDGKQARRLGVSGPLGEMFDHGLDSYIVFLIPFCLLSVFGRDAYSVPVFRGYLIVLSIVLNFYASHWEKYNTGTLYLPWGYDLSMWVSTLMFLVAGVYGPEVYKVRVLGGVTFVQALEVVIYCTGLFTTLPVAIYNVHLAYKAGSIKTKSLAEALRPVWPMAILSVSMTAWALLSPGDVIERDPRAFLLLFGTVFSNIASRLIVAEMSEQRCDAISWINIPLVLSIVVSINYPEKEMGILYTSLLFAILAHVHYGVCVVRQMCAYFGVKCFVVPKSKRK